MATKRPKYKIEVIGVPLTDQEDGWYWRTVAKNGEILFWSEMYEKRGNAIRSAKRVAADLAGSAVEILGERG